MTLAKHIQVNSSYTRSINLERDLEGEGVRPYIPTTRALQTLERIVETLQGDACPRAWSLLGPYGSGKSAFALFLTQLLGRPEHKGTRHARLILSDADDRVARRLKQRLANSQGYCAITLTGSPEPLARRLVEAMRTSAELFLKGRRGTQPAFLKKLKALEGVSEIPVSAVIGCLKEMQQAVSRTGGKGILLIIDELGKFLEYEARHRNSIDIFLLQALAEHAHKKSEAPLLFLALLHQGFEQYFAGLGDQLKNEWKKVQGRFESVPFLESSEQILRVIRAAIIPDLPEVLRSSVHKQSKKIVKVLQKEAALPGGLQEEVALELFEGSYPLHPMSLLILPSLCQKVAQNERTLFSYLGSHEPHGFQDSLQRLDIESAIPRWIMPWAIFEYFIINQPGLSTDHLTYRRWAEVMTAIDRLGDAPPEVGRLLKTIGLLNILGAQGGLKASEGLLRLCYEIPANNDGVSFEDAIQCLQTKSVITFRRFNGEYRVWQGSDFDVDGALQEQKDQLGRIELAKLLNDRKVLPPIVARRYAIESGTLRYFLPQFVETANEVARESVAQPTFLICLPDSIEEQEAFKQRLLEDNTQTNVVVALLHGGASLRHAVTEVAAYERVQRNYPDVASDPVTQRELKERYAHALQVEHELVSGILEDSAGSEWFWCGQPFLVNSKRELQVLLSHALEKTYSKAPTIHSELVNRDKPSSNANAARKKLLVAMLEAANQEDLGFEKFPAEKGLYRSILMATGIHAKRDGQWIFQAPTNQSTNLGPTWSAIEVFFDEAEQAPRALQDLFAILAAPSYGVKEGLIPILFLAFYQAYSDEIALYDNGYYCPFMTVELIERMIKEPASFSAQRFKIDHIRETVYRVYIDAVTSSDSSHDYLSLITAAKPLARFMMNLPEYTKGTKRISAEAQEVREKFFASKSPLQLMFFHIPEALGLRPLVGAEANNTLLDEFASKFKSAVSELKVAYHSLLNEFQENLKANFYIEKGFQLHEIRETLRGRYSGLQEYTIDVNGLKAFIGRIIDPYGDESQWLISLASFLARKPPEKWTDEDAAVVEYRLVEHSKRLRELETLRSQYEHHSDRITDVEFVLLKTISQKRGEIQLIVAIDEQKRRAVRSVKDKIRSLLSDLPNEDLAKVTLAILSEELGYLRAEDSSLGTESEVKKRKS